MPPLKIHAVCSLPACCSQGYERRDRAVLLIELYQWDFHPSLPRRPFPLLPGLLFEVNSCLRHPEQPWQECPIHVQQLHTACPAAARSGGLCRTGRNLVSLAAGEARQPGIAIFCWVSEEKRLCVWYNNNRTQEASIISRPGRAPRGAGDYGSLHYMHSSKILGGSSCRDRHGCFWQ